MANDMNEEDQSTSLMFTNRGALLGFIAYLILILLVIVFFIW